MKRRRFLKTAATMTGAIATGYVLNLSGCGTGHSSQPATDSLSQGDSRSLGDMDGEGRPDGDNGLLAMGDVLIALYASSDVAALEDAVRKGLAHVDLGWLGPGDTVFVKLACNSGNPHPAVTSPAAVSGLCAELFAQGAGRVIVGDQAGVESVRLTEGEARFGSTRALMEGNGLYQAIITAGAEPHFFDDQGYDAGYFEATPPAGHHWQQPMILPKVIKEVDHIVYLPRLSSHALAGYTHGLKNAVGWLRDDSRYHMHNDAESLHEKYAEINYCTEIASRLRLVYTFAEQLMLHQGPDAGTLAVADPRIIIASDNIANHDAVSASLLHHIDAATTQAPGLLFAYGEGSKADMANKVFLTTVVESATGLPWGDGGAGYTALAGHSYWEGIASDRALSRAYELQGGVPDTIAVHLRGAPLDGELRAALDAYVPGLFDWHEDV